MSLARLLMWSAFTVTLTISSWSVAQERGGQGRGFRGFGRGFGTDKTTLVGLEQVQKELKITDEQKPKLTEAVTAYRTKLREEMSGARDLSREERQKKMTEVREKLSRQVDKELKTILSKEQFKRLSQIAVQQRGVRALTEKDMIQALKLSEDQVGKMNEALVAQREEMRKLFEDMRGNPDARSKMREAMDKLRKKTETQVMAALTDQQKKKYESMKGKPFELDRSAMFRGRGRQGGGRGGQGGGDRPRRRPDPDA